MRNIKFRAKSFIDNKFIYGNLVRMDDEEGNQCFIVPFYNHASSLSCKEIICMSLIPVNEKTIGQYTGLKGKDGKEIYEGDILESSNDEIFVVEWQTFSASWKLQNTEHHYLFYKRDISTMKVIGNIYENPELLDD